MRVRQHNEYFRSVAAERKSCKECKSKFVNGEVQWCWGEYSRLRWYTITWFCKHCFDNRVKNRLLSHSKPCGCMVNILAYRGETLPEWLSL
jgi:hypothetical protein